ncbi:Palmitoyltransferase [Mycena venus]|uniref:Palmitoyltransferase n=1 Tax=Mycena venus TaxID=2733690 RepID=A0A8H6YZ92_9AGAR|nr:Palmitoyltransferase [Mycena venus]
MQPPPPTTSTAAVSPDTATAADLSFSQALSQTTPEEDTNIFVAAQRGDVPTIRALLDSGRARATDRDAQNITPLHWAAINAQLPACRLLLDAGADVDALGGDLVATPMQWAARGGYLYVIQLLIAHGADPTIADSQGYNSLHLVTHSSSIMPLLYLLHQPVNVDSRDSQGHTALMWAAYQGDAMSVDLLLRHGASPTVQDDVGLTPLHWAVVRGNRVAIRRLIEKGALLSTKDAEGRTPRDMAVELKSLGAWRRALEEGGWVSFRCFLSFLPSFFLSFSFFWVGFGGALSESAAVVRAACTALLANPSCRARGGGGAYQSHPPDFFSSSWDEEGNKAARAVENTRLAIFLLPTLVFGAVFTTLAGLPWYTGILLAVAEFFGMHHIVTRVLLNKSSYTDSVNTTPYFAGIIAGSVVWVCYAWVSRLVGQTQSHALAHLLFALCVGLCAYNFFRAVTLDPGTCPRPGSDAELKSIIEDLASEGRLNGQTFCIQCMARKPLRSKHCRVCDKCVARSDHHCPWVWNCVGANNHRQFVIFVSTLVMGVGLFDYLTYAYFSSVPIPVPSEGTPTGSSSCPLPASLCAVTAHDAFLVAVAAWATLQLSWTSILLASQLWQIARQMTTLEVSNLGRYGFMGGRGGASLNGQMGHRHSHQAAAPVVEGVDGGELDPSASGAPTGAAHTHSSTGFLMNLLGFDRFTRGRAASGLARASKASNPFDLGMVRNCRDFWTKGKELGVEYERLYDVPMEGFEEARKRREREEDMEGEGLSVGTSARKGGRKGILESLGMSMGMGRAGSSRGGYEPISQV